MVTRDLFNGTSCEVDVNIYTFLTVVDPSHFFYPLLLTVNAASELTECRSFLFCHLLHLFLYPFILFVSSLHLLLTGRPSNKVTVTTPLPTPLIPISLSFLSSCSWRVSQPCLSSRTECLITWIVWPNIGIPLTLTPSLFPFFPSMPLPLFSLSSAAVTSQCQPWPSHFRVCASHPSVCPHSSSQLHFTHTPLVFATYHFPIVLFLLSPVLSFFLLSPLHISLSLSLSALPWQHSALSLPTETGLLTKKRMEREGQREKWVEEKERRKEILPVGLISAQLIGLYSSLSSIAGFTLHSSALCVHRYVCVCSVNHEDEGCAWSVHFVDGAAHSVCMHESCGWGPLFAAVVAAEEVESA